MAKKPGNEQQRQALATIETHTVGIVSAVHTAWNLREWLQQVACDRTLQPVLDSHLPRIRAELEINLINSGLADAATKLPAMDGLTATSLIAFVEKLELPGLHLRMPSSEPPAKWTTLSRMRALRIAMHVCGENNEQLFDPESDSDLDLIEQMGRNQLADLFAACEAHDPLDYDPRRSAKEDACYVNLLQMSAIVGRSKKTLQRLYEAGELPAPAVEGGGGRQHEWKWQDVRPILETQYNKQLPAVFPADRFIRS